jgi:hypothetical protein
MFTESLTVRILGDSSDLQRELESVLSQLDGFQGRLSAAGEATRALSDGLRSFSEAGTPLRQVSTQLSAVDRQFAQLSSHTVTINVQPALAALAQLSATAQAVATQLAQLSAVTVAGPSAGGRPNRMAAGFSSGGLVEGPAGFDSVPAMLTEGEFVLSREVTQALGTTFLTALNRNPVGAVSRTTPPAVMSGPVSSTTNHFGGITVNVTEPGGVNDVIRDLRMHGAALRVRRG